MSTKTLFEKHKSSWLCLSDERGAAQKYPLNDIAGDSDTLNVDKDIVCETASHHQPDLSD